jgi:predicted metal-binding membrane protein
MTQCRDGRRGALVMGVCHGACCVTCCVTCCWALMALLFVLGVMNLAWVAVLAAIVLAFDELMESLGGVVEVSMS